MVNKSICEHWKSYWEQTNDYPIVMANVTKPGKESVEPPKYLEWFADRDRFVKTADKIARWLDSRIFLGDAVPMFNVTFGADDFAAYLGADLHISEDHSTSWPDHPLKDLNGAEIAFDANGKWWTKTREFYTVLREKLGDSVMLSAPTLSAGMDALAGIFGVNELLYATIDEPEAVHEALERINTAYTAVLGEVRKLFEYEKYGSITRHGLYTTGVIGVPQNDFGYMISDEMFRKFAMPCTIHEIELLDHAEYHLDGKGNLTHLETLCSIKKLHTFQWVPGAGAPSELDWTWLYKRIIELGKNIFVYGNPQSIMELLHKIPTSRMCVALGVETVDEYERFMDDMHALKLEK